MEVRARNQIIRHRPKQRVIPLPDRPCGTAEGLDALGADEHTWSHPGPPGTGMVTDIVDYTTLATPTSLCMPRCLTSWRAAPRRTTQTGSKKAAPRSPPRSGRFGFVPRLRERDKRRAARSHLRPEAFHVVKLGGAMVDEVRRRVQQDTLGKRKGYPIYGI